MARIFLCHASEDKAQVREVYHRLRAIDGFEPWLDEEDLLPGQDWTREIPRALQKSDFILVFFSRNSVAKRGYVQREMKLALDALQELPEGTIHTIPVRLDDCEVPDSFRHYHYANLFAPNGFDRIVGAIRAELAKRSGPTLPPILQPFPRPSLPERAAAQDTAVEPLGDNVLAGFRRESGTEPARDQVFISYAHHDARWLERLQIVLKPLTRNKTISIWDDSQIQPGTQWKAEITKALASAKVAVLLVSQHFLASDFIAHDELQPLLQAAKKDGLTILWVAVGASLYKDTDIAVYQAVNNPAKPLNSLRRKADVDAELVKIAEKIKEAATQPITRGDTAFTNSIGMEFVLIPAGTFLMGSPDSYTEANDNEKPVHQVTISQAFYLGKYPVTQAQWEAIMGDDNPSQFKHDPTRPVERVSWHGALAFLRELTEREGGGDYRLPTEAQWEYACRAGTKTPRYHPDCNAIAWYDGNSNGYSQPVGQKLPNAWGLHDMLGNVYEWCLDGRRQYTAAAAVDPIGPTDAGANHVIRGGSWDHSARFVRAALRDWYPPDTRSNSLGFRCASSGPSK
jgi:formylglycine-generating enzyme required for sulfatase activity